MELRELAERILFSPDLETKIWCPDVITDEQPGKAFASPEAPHRDEQLQFSLKQGKSEFPPLHTLEKESTRGKILHFFANHELLATELMALVLLKFPDAPRSFRRGVLKTLKDEQEHTRIYVERLKAMGVEFGQYPVNGFFWKMIAPMQTPMDYVSRLSLTFEQANLDFSKFFASQFQTIGDEDSHKLLERIYRDEIGHVGYGLKWFRRWKKPEQSDWEAYEEQLDFPLSPRRAKAEHYNVEGRERVGFDRDFIQRLYVYSKSKGRTPGIYYFNPYAEQFLAAGPGFTPNQRQVSFETDLETLPMFLCRSDDVVLMRREPSLDFLVTLKQAGIELPQVEVLKAGKVARSSELLDRKIGFLKPWAWSPDAISLMKPIMPQLTRPAPPVGDAWDAQFRLLFGKDWGAQQLRGFLKDVGELRWLCPIDAVGQVVTGVDDALTAIDQLRKSGYPRTVVKSIFGSAGGNMLRLWEESLTEPQVSRIRNMLKREKKLLIEPWLDRLADFSVQWEVDETGLRTVGWTHLRVDARGQYQGTLCLPAFTRGLSPELARFAHDGETDRMTKLYDRLAERLEPLLVNVGFKGPIGIDAAIYRDREGIPKLKPIIEINPRFTMGRLALELNRNSAPGCAGQLHIVSLPDLKCAGFDTFKEWSHALRETHPVLHDDRGRLCSGMVFLNDTNVAEGCMAVWQVERDYKAIHPLGRR
jgi:uncharacterized ferritin-like protein (DUF455 family)